MAALDVDQVQAVPDLDLGGPEALVQGGPHNASYTRKQSKFHAILEGDII